MALFAIGMSMAIICSVAGDFLVKKGSMAIDPSANKSFGSIWRLFNPYELFQFLRRSGIISNWKLWFGVALLAFHFGGYMLAMRVAPVTVVEPMMSATYIINTIIAKIVLRERVVLLRWAGIMVIVIGIIGLVYSR